MCVKLSLVKCQVTLSSKSKSLSFSGNTCVVPSLYLKIKLLLLTMRVVGSLSIDRTEDLTTS